MLGWKFEAKCTAIQLLCKESRFFDSLNSGTFWLHNLILSMRDTLVLKFELIWTNKSAWKLRKAKWGFEICKTSVDLVMQKWFKVLENLGIGFKRHPKDSGKLKTSIWVEIEGLPRNHNSLTSFIVICFDHMDVSCTICTC